MLRIKDVSVMQSEVRLLVVKINWAIKLLVYDFVVHFACLQCFIACGGSYLVPMKLVLNKVTVKLKPGLPYKNSEHMLQCQCRFVIHNNIFIVV